MKNLIVITFLIIVTSAHALPRHVNLQEFGLSFDIPPGWTGQVQGDYIILGHQSIPGLMILFENKTSDAVALKRLAMQGIRDEGIQLNATGNFSVNNNSVRGMYQGIFSGAQVKSYAIGLINGLGSGINIFILTETNKFSQAHKAEAEKLAKSVKFFKSKKTDQTLQWQNKIVGRQLKYMSTVSDSDYVGGSSGFSEVITIDLCSNGRFIRYYNSHASFNSGDASAEAGSINELSGFGFSDATGQGAGKYKIYSLGEESFLEFTSDKGKVTEYDLSVNDDGATYLDKTRYMVLVSKQCR